MAKILLIDDSRLSRRIIKSVLAESGYTFREAADGEQGLSALKDYRPDCIILDLLMPKMDGHTCLQRLRESGCDVPVVVCSADIQKASLALCEELGIDGFVNKPVDGDELKASVAAALTHNLEITK